MTKYDAEKWDHRYITAGHDLAKPRQFLLDHLHFFPHTGRGLDVAMGLGHNAQILSKRGLKMIGVDISRVALNQAQWNYPFLQLLQCDLPAIRFKRHSFSVILNFWFLDRTVTQYFRDWLKPGGILMFETMIAADENRNQNVNPDYLLAPHELRKTFADWTILVYDEDVNKSVKGKVRQAVRLLAQKPIKSE